MFRYLPEQASDFAHKVDYANYVVTDISVFFTVAIVGAMLYFAARYRRVGGVDHETPRIEGNNTLEVIWTVVPLLICVWVGWLGYDSFVDMRTAPAGAVEINVVGKKWAWDFEYKNGKKTTGELVVPVDEPVKLVMTSTDVLHSFFIPVMRTKHDVIPGRYTYIWFRPIKTGDFQVFCTEYCGDQHSGMLARLKVLPRAEYDRWVNDFSEEARLAGLKPADQGKALYVSKNCVTCHSLDGSRKVGPSWLKVFGSKHGVDGGQEVQVDENYLKESILYPAKQIVSGYANAMPSYEGQLSDQEVHALIEFIKTVDGSTSIEVAKPKAAALDTTNMSPAERGKLIFDNMENMCAGCHSIDGSQLACPTFKGLYGKEREFADGTKLLADDAYIIESIKYPHKKLVKPYGPAMPNVYENKFSEQELNDLVAYIKSLKE
jgi:cytochrome c oxidase subunit 2